MFFSSLGRVLGFKSKKKMPNPLRPAMQHLKSRFKSNFIVSVMSFAHAQKSFICEWFYPSQIHHHPVILNSDQST